MPLVSTVDRQAMIIRKYARRPAPASAGVNDSTRIEAAARRVARDVGSAVFAVLEQLVCGADLSSEDGCRALHVAATDGDALTLALLVRNGCPVDCVVDGQTALHAAARLNDERCCQLLLDHGATPHSVQPGMATALQVATSTGSHECMRLLEAAARGAMSPSTTSPSNERRSSSSSTLSTSHSRTLSGGGGGGLGVDGDGDGSSACLQPLRPIDQSRPLPAPPPEALYMPVTGWTDTLDMDAIINNVYVHAMPYALKPFLDQYILCAYSYP